MDDRLKLQDRFVMIKHKIMMGMFRLGCLLYILVVKVRHNFRGSFQTGFRNPTTQDQYIGFNVGSAILLGSIQIT
jgi:hypothetical protein